MVTEAAGQNSQIGKARTAGHVSGLAFVKVLMMEHLQRSFEMAYDYFCKALDIRRSGSAALDLCAIAAGRAELYFELLLSPWDYAAGSLIVEEAGGVITTVEEDPISLKHPCSILARNSI